MLKYNSRGVYAETICRESVRFKENPVLLLAEIVLVT